MFITVVNSGFCLVEEGRESMNYTELTRGRTEWPLKCDHFTKLYMQTMRYYLPSLHTQQVHY